MTANCHLILQDLTLLPGGEWSIRGDGWLVARVAEGAGYWLSAGQARDLGPGDVLAAVAASGGTLRASRLGPLKLDFFRVEPRLLSGLLVAGDLQRLEDAPTLFHSAREPLARRFAEIAAQPVRAGLASRGRLLQVWTEALAQLMVAPEEPGQAAGTALRLEDLLSRISDDELGSYSLSELSEQLHCSERHVSRVFHEKFGMPFRDHQTEVRLRRARQLLEESGDKIINIAYESGYRHLGLFNRMFKKHFSMTPSQWRERAQKSKAGPARKPVSRPVPAPPPPGSAYGPLAGPNTPTTPAFLASVLLAVCLLLFPRVSLAQTNTAAVQTNTASAAATPSNTFEVRKYVVKGNTKLSPSTINAIFDQAKGKAVTLDQIRKALAELQTEYRDRGWATVAVTLPQQQLTNATVIVQVTEAPLSAITVVGNRYYSSNNIMRTLPSLEPAAHWPDFLLNARVFQRELDLANANRDRQIYPILGPGIEPGTSELTLKVKDRLPVHGRYELSNPETPGTPNLRMNLNAQYGNLWQLDHQLGVQYSFTPQSMKTSDEHNNSLLDEPEIANYSMFYRMPIGEATPVDQLIESDPLSFGYSESTHQFRLPPSTGRPEFTLYASRSTSDTGIQRGPTKLVTQTSFITITSQDSGEDVTLNEGIGGKFSVPLRELAGIRSAFSFGIDFKRYRLSSYNTNNFHISVVVTNSNGEQTIENTVSTGQPTRHSTVDYLPFNVGWDASRPDKFGQTFFNAGINFNYLHPSSSDQGFLSGDQDFRRASYSPQTKASYVTVNMGASREQAIYKEWSVLVRANGQWSDGPLINNEQFPMGGLAGVRGYLDAAAYGDMGWRMQFEPRTPMIMLGLVDGTVPFWLRGSAFVDYGQLFAAADAPSHQDFMGWGFGATASIGDHFDARVTVAWPVLSTRTVQADGTHLYFALGFQF
jgi:hemolysin activation/secretion protein